MYYNRKTQTIEEAGEYQQKSLDFLYKTIIGRILLNLIVARPWLSKLSGIYQNSAFSKKDIAPFVQKYRIDPGESEIAQFTSFNDFFTRKKTLKLGEFDPHALLSVADAKMRYYTITDDLKLTIKNSIYDIEDIVADKTMAEAYRNGTCIVFRLSVDDYHRYHFIDHGKLLAHKKIKGKLHTVRPISDKYKVFAQNTREVSLLETEHFGKVVQIEVGALLVGKIVNHDRSAFQKMQEKGYFQFGGSTIVLLIHKPIQFDEDIARMNASDIETQVHAGERIGIIC